MLRDSTSQFHPLRKQCMPQKNSEQQMEYTPSNQLIICFASPSKVGETSIVRIGSS